jgi:hypothetical protein
MLSPKLVSQKRTRKPIISSKTILIPPNRSNNKKFSLCYSRPIHDSRVYNDKEHRYIPHFLEIVSQGCPDDIREAKQRIYQTKFGTFRYHPSKNYGRFIASLKLMKVI